MVYRKFIKLVEFLNKIILEIFENRQSGRTDSTVMRTLYIVGEQTVSLSVTE